MKQSARLLRFYVMYVGVSFLCHILAVQCIGLPSMIMEFPGHTHLFFQSFIDTHSDIFKSTDKTNIQIPECNGNFTLGTGFLMLKKENFL